MFPATDDHSNVNRIFKLYFPMISNNLNFVSTETSNIDNLSFGNAHLVVELTRGILFIENICLEKASNSVHMEIKAKHMMK